MIKISASILSSNFANLESEIKKLEKAETDMIHIDVMDGHFVNNLTIGPVVVSSIRSCTQLPFDVHLMISNPDKYVDKFIEVGSDIITIHYESQTNVLETLLKIKNCGKKAGLAIKPETKANVVLEFLKILDVILIMTVEPGFGGQEFIFEMLDKIKTIKRYIKLSDRSIDLEVDGGLNNQTNKDAIKAGANIIVAGSYIFNAKDYSERIQELKCLI